MDQPYRFITLHWREIRVILLFWETRTTRGSVFQKTSQGINTVQIYRVHAPEMCTIVMIIPRHLTFTLKEAENLLLPCLTAPWWQPEWQQWCLLTELPPSPRTFCGLEFSSGTSVATLRFWNRGSGRQGRVVIKPIIVGFHGNTATFNENTVQLNESNGSAVEPESLFDAQLELRLAPFRIGSKPFARNGKRFATRRCQIFCHQTEHRQR